jgi:hypothetical protein
MGSSWTTLEETTFSCVGSVLKLVELSVLLGSSIKTSSKELEHFWGR